MNKNNNIKEDIASHCQMLLSVVAQEKEYLYLMIADVISGISLLSIAYYNFSSFVSNIIILSSIYLLFNGFKRLNYYRAVRLMKNDLRKSLFKLMNLSKSFPRE